jgi:hypothetical protein
MGDVGGIADGQGAFLGRAGCAQLRCYAEVDAEPAEQGAGFLGQAGVGLRVDGDRLDVGSTAVSRS